jgi:hypothetical protein
MTGALAVLLVAAPLVAYHRFSGEFDRDAPIQLEGVVVRLEWVNPQWIHVEVSRMLQGSTEILPDDPSEESCGGSRAARRTRSWSGARA